MPMDGDALVRKLSPREHRLPNGMTLLVREDHSAPVVAVVTHVKAGYFDEPDALVGISHVLEHMYFKGTTRRGVGEIARATKAAGGYLNAGTIYDHTSYYTVLPSSALDMGLDIQADALIHSQVDEEELRKELLVIIQEVKRKEDNPGAMAAETLYETMFDVHPMRRWRMGREEALSGLSRADVLDYYRNMYRGSAITLIVAGDVDPERVVARVEALYADVPAGDPERPARNEPERTGSRFREMSGDIAHTYGELGWRTPGSLHDDTPALDILGAVLGQGRASRLYRGVRERGLVSSIDAYNYTPTEIGVFGVSLECDPDRAADALRATWGEIERVRRAGVTDEELDRVRTLVQARLLRRLETAEGQANLLAEWHALGDWRRAGEYLDRVRGLTPGDVRGAADRHLDPDRATALVYRPASAPALGWADAALATELRAREPEPLAPISLAPVAAVLDPVTLGAPAVEEDVFQHAMDGGRLVVKPRSRAPLVSMAVFRPGGILHESPAVAGITGLMMRSSVKGTATRTAERIALESEGLGGSISAGAGSDYLSWSFTVPSEHFSAGLSLLADVALNPTFPEAEVERERRVLLADLESLRDDMARYPMRLLLKAAFDGHPYGFGPDLVERAIRELDGESLRRWHATELAEPWVFVVGDVEPDRVAERVAAAFGTPTRSVRDDRPPAVWPAGRRSESVRRDRAQSAIAVGFPGPERNHEDAPVLQVLSNAVSGLGNRLFEELRGRRSLAYTVTAYPIARRYGGAFVGYIATSPDRADEAREALVEELIRLRDEPPSEEELERARRYTLGAWQIRTQTNGAQLSELAGALMLGPGLREIREFEDRINAVSRERVLEAARRWFEPDRLVEGAVLGRSD
ncbi:MAG TPA: pitrilysin family protein [Longimicrobiales bacterium]|nr:pitrilysin family protein [Longimicrobiales bacterium]